MSLSNRTQSKCLFPAWLDLGEVPVLMVGAGQVARRKTFSLVEARADLTVVAPRFLQDFLQWQESGYLSIHRREFEEGDLDGKRLVFACTDNADLNESIVKNGKERGIWGGSATPSGEIDLFPGSVLRRGGLSISVSSAGEAPLVSRVLRDCLEDLFTDDWEDLFLRFARERASLLKNDFPLESLEEKISLAFCDSVRFYAKHPPDWD
jgi:siroheme synthase-like protein